MNREKGERENLNANKLEKEKLIASRSKELAKKFRSQMVEEHQRESLDERNDRRVTRRRVSPRCKTVFVTRDDPSILEMHEDCAILPAKSQINNERKNKGYSKSPNNMNTNNRRMTGNVNIYICSETNNPEGSKRRLKLQSCTETSSDTITERSNSRCISASSAASSCKLLNGIQEKRRKLQAKQPITSVRREQDDNDGEDATSHGICSKELSESSKEQMDFKLTDECRDTISVESTRDGCCCRDSSSLNLPQDSSLNPVIPRVCDKSVPACSTICREARVGTTDDSDGSLNATYRKYQYRNNERNNVYEKCTTCDVWIDGNNSLPRSICNANCTKMDACSEYTCGYRDGRLQRAICCKETRRELPQEFPRDCRKEPATQERWSTCSCIAEEEEDRSANISRGEKELPCDKVECPEDTPSVCRAPLSSTLIETTTTICENVMEERCRGTAVRESTFGDPVECPRNAIVCRTTFENSEEAPKVTGVCKEFVAEEKEPPPKDTAVCGTTFGGPKEGPSEGSSEEVTVCESALSDSKEAPKETISKTIPDANFFGRGDAESVSLNDAKDKLAGENIDIANLNSQNTGNAGSAVQFDNKYNILASNNLTGVRSGKNVMRNEQTKRNVSNNQSRDAIVPIRPTIGNSKKPLSRNAYSTAVAHKEFHSRRNLISNYNPREISKISTDKRGKLKLSPFDRPTKAIHLQQRNEISKDITMRKIAENSKEKEKIQDIAKKQETTEEKPRESILHRSFKRLVDIIKHYRAQLKDRMEIKQIEAEKTITNDVEQLADISGAEEKIDYEKERQDKVPHVKEMGDIAHVVGPQPTIPIADFTVPEEDKKTDVPSANQKRLIPKLLRVIAAKRSHLLHPVVTVTSEYEPQEPKLEIKSVPVEIAVNEYAAREEAIPREKLIPQEEAIPQEKILPQEESISPREVRKMPATVQFAKPEEIKPESLQVPVEVKAEDTIDISVDEDVASKDFAAAITKIYVPCPRKMTTEERQQVPCTYDSFSDSDGYSCSKQIRVSCPQKEQHQYEPIVHCKCRQIHSVSNDCSKLIAKCAKHDNTRDTCACKINGLEQKKDYAHCYLSVERATCVSTQYLKSCLKSDKPKFRDVSPLTNICRHICINCCRKREDCTCKETILRCRACEECRCKCATCYNCSRTRNNCRWKSPARCTHHAETRDQSWRKKMKKSSCEKAMICVYCDNPRDKCRCRAAIGKCSRCGLPSDVCDCRMDGSADPSRKRMTGEPDESRMIRVTSWKPKREIRRYFARDPADLRSDSTEECRCCVRLKWQRPEELPYQRLNVFSDVMNELQQKMSESVCCTRCHRNPCRCGSQVDQDERVEGRKANGYVECPETEKSLGSKLPGNKSTGSKLSSRNMWSNNCRCNSSPGKELGRITLKRSTSIRHVGCICKLSPCRCRRGRKLRNRRPLAKCYYCKSLPCTCITAR